MGGFVVLLCLLGVLGIIEVRSRGNKKAFFYTLAAGFALAVSILLGFGIFTWFEYVFDKKLPFCFVMLPMLMTSFAIHWYFPISMDPRLKNQIPLSWKYFGLSSAVMVVLVALSYGLLGSDLDPRLSLIIALFAWAFVDTRLRARLGTGAVKS